MNIRNKWSIIVIILSFLLMILTIYLTRNKQDVSTNIDLNVNDDTWNNTNIQEYIYILSNILLKINKQITNEQSIKISKCMFNNIINIYNKNIINEIFVRLLNNGKMPVDLYNLYIKCLN
jgi:cbb3-type cytochrome oxidase subunit 3